MIDGHGDDAYKYGQKIRINFSSNVYNHVNHNGLREHLYHRMESIRSYPEPEPYSLEQALAHSLHLSDGKEVCVTNGATEAIYLIAQTFRGKNSAILMPTFSEYADACRLHHHKIQVIYALDMIPSGTNLIWICNPNNPTGAVYPKEILEQIAQIAREKELIIFSDEIYDRLVMDGYQHTSIASLAPDVFCVTFSGLSKSHMIAGFRIGWMILSGAKERAKGYIEGIKMLSSMRLCSNVPAQAIVQTALGGYQSVAEYVKPGGRVYEQRECIYNALRDIPGISVVKPHAAFYIFPKIDTEKFNITDDEQFALDFLHEKQVLLVPGKGFNWGAPDHFRVVYLPNTRQLETASQKLKEFLSTYRQGR